MFVRPQDHIFCLMVKFGKLRTYNRLIKRMVKMTLNRTLMACKGSEEKILEVMKQIRGDYAIILIEGDQIFILKDYFGKRSLLVGMS